MNGLEQEVKIDIVKNLFALFTRRRGQMGGGRPTSKTQEKRSEETNKEDAIQRGPAGRRQSSRNRFGGPRAKCGVITCRTSGDMRCGVQHNTPTLKWT